MSVRVYEVCHLRCVCKNWKGYVVKHNYVNEGVFNCYTRQLHVSAFTGRNIPFPKISVCLLIFCPSKTT